ncbi:hypothetical protein PIB30_030421, partial [Stylosanthes scabra]|nr:hypothetical protein [Stylosanthes scabra]
KPFSAGIKRLEVVLVKFNPLIHFGVSMGAKFSPKVRFFSAQRVEDELRGAARDFFENGGIEVDLEKRTVYLTPIIYKGSNEICYLYANSFHRSRRVEPHRVLEEV